MSYMRPSLSKRERKEGGEKKAQWDRSSNEGDPAKPVFRDSSKAPRDSGALQEIALFVGAENVTQLSW